MRVSSIGEGVGVPAKRDPVDDVRRPRPRRRIAWRDASVAQLDRAAGFYPAGSGFESWRGHRRRCTPVGSPMRSPAPYLSFAGKRTARASGRGPHVSRSGDHRDDEPQLGRWRGAFVALGIVAIVAILQLIGFWKVAREGRRVGRVVAAPASPAASTRSPSARSPRSAAAPPWWVILLYVPIVNIVVLAILSIDLAKSFGKSDRLRHRPLAAALHLLPDARLRLVGLRRPGRARAGLIRAVIRPVPGTASRSRP